MAGAPRVYYRNYSSSDNTNVIEGKTGDIVLAPSALGFSPQLGYEFKEWNSNRSGTGATYPVGEACFYDTLYAIWQEIDADVIITYQGNPIATMDASGSKTLLTADSYCENDIVVSYTKPSAPAPTLQAKTNVAPTTSSQTITADSGYDGLSSVQINAMPTGSVTVPSQIGSSTGVSRSVSSTYITLSKTISVTPTVTTPGYISSGTAGNTEVTLSSFVSTQSAHTWTPTTSDQTVITAATWVSGDQKVKGDYNLTPYNIKSGVSIFNVTGTLVASDHPPVDISNGMSDYTTVPWYYEFNCSLIVAGNPLLNVLLNPSGYDEPNWAEFSVDDSNGCAFIPLGKYVYDDQNEYATVDPTFMIRFKNDLDYQPQDMNSETFGNNVSAVYVPLNSDWIRYYYSSSAITDYSCKLYWDGGTQTIPYVYVLRTTGAMDKVTFSNDEVFLQLWLQYLFGYDANYQGGA